MSEEDLEIRDGLAIPGWELTFTATRSGGPGGQHANTSSTRVTLHWSIQGSSVLSDFQKRQLQRRLKHLVTADGLLQLSVSDTRSQHRNRSIARDRLAEEVRRGLQRDKRRKKTTVSRNQKRKRLENKRRRSRKKELRKSPPPRDD